jgi:HK97 family phage prohead protease
MKTKDIRAREWKAVGDKGSFQGYASIFGNVDDGFDVVVAGAFKEFAKTDGKVARSLHARTRQLIGLAVSAGRKGLHFDGELVLEDPLAQRAYRMKSGTLDGMSIGFDVLEGGATNITRAASAPDRRSSSGKFRRSRSA